MTGSGADETALLDGFTITGGNANGSDDTDGGGMINVQTVAIPARPMLVNCTFYGNSADGNGTQIGLGGGGIHNEEGNLTLRKCKFQGNTSIGGGAGLYNVRSSPTIIDSVFDRNRVLGSLVINNGGGIRNNSSDAMIINCTFTGNSAKNGGGIWNSSNPSPTVVNCTLIRNEAINGAGGGIESFRGNFTIINCTFVENKALRVAGGLAESFGSLATVRNCIFWGNSTTTDSNPQISGGATDVT